MVGVSSAIVDENRNSDKVAAPNAGKHGLELAMGSITITSKREVKLETQNSGRPSPHVGEGFM